MIPLFKMSILLSIFLFTLTSCASKVNGKYHSKYSYHPYYSLYTKNMSNKINPIKKKITKTKKEKTKSSLNPKSRFPN